MGSGAEMFYAKKLSVQFCSILFMNRAEHLRLLFSSHSSLRSEQNSKNSLMFRQAIGGAFVGSLLHNLSCVE
jgi:hypothetical protein